MSIIQDLRVLLSGFQNRDPANLGLVKLTDFMQIMMGAVAQDLDTTQMLATVRSCGQ